MSAPSRTRARTDDSERSVIYTIDALIMGLIMLAGLGIAFTLIPTPGDVVSGGFSETQLETTADDTLSITQETGSLSEAVRYWDASSGTWANPQHNGRYISPPSGHPIHDEISILEEQGIGVSLVVEYQTPSGVIEQEQIIYQGTPGADAVTVSRSVTLGDDEELVGPSSGTTLEDASSYTIPDAAPGNSHYNTVTVYLTLWRV